MKHIVTVIYPDEASFAYSVTNDLSAQSNLELVFAEWNRGSGMESEMFINSKKRSLSVNDIVCLDGTYYQCKPVGWEEVSTEYVNQLEKDVANHPRRYEGAWFALIDVMWERAEPAAVL